MSKPQLFSHDRERRKGSKELVAIDPDSCPECGQGLETEGVTTAALLRHGGYGETRKVTRRYCVCGFSIEGQVESLSPRDET